MHFDNEMGCLRLKTMSYFGDSILESLGYVGPTRIRRWTIPSTPLHIQLTFMRCTISQIKVD